MQGLKHIVMICLSFSLLTVGLTGTSHAVEKVVLFEHAVIVPQKRNDRLINQARGEALLHVLSKVSGRTKIETNPVVMAEVLKAENYTVKESFEDSDIMIKSVIGENLKTDLMKILFDEQAIKRILTNAKLPVWSENRPQSLIWLASSENGRRQMLGDINISERKIDEADIQGVDDPSQAMVLAAKVHAKRRAVPIMFPLMDLDDQFNVNVNDFFNAGPDFLLPTVSDASERYSPDAILMGKVESQGSRIKGVWQLSFNQQIMQTSSIYENREAFIADGITLLTERLSDQYAVTAFTVAEGKIDVDVANVFNLSQYKKVTDYLSQVPGVKAVVTKEVRKDGLLLSVDIDVSRGQFVDLVNLEQKLTQGLAPQINDGKTVYLAMPNEFN